MIGLESSSRGVGRMRGRVKVTKAESAESEEDHEDSNEEVGKAESDGEVENTDEEAEDTDGAQSEDGYAADGTDSEMGTEEADGDSENDASPKSSSNANPGWADAMRKILSAKKPKKKKTIVLSKAKKLTEVKVKAEAELLPFEIQTEDGETKREIVAKEEKDEEKESAPVKKRRREQLGIRVKPSVLDRERERALQKIATKGVVQLFNVVRQQQTEIDKKLEEAGPLERKREKVMKSIDKQGFLDVLMGGSKNVPIEDAKQAKVDTKKEEEKSDKIWSVLRDDFVMSAKLKDWDKKAPEEEDSSSAEEMDSD